MKTLREQVDDNRSYPLEEAIGILKKGSGVKFDESVEIAVKLNVDPRKADQMIRGVVTLPAGTGKKIRILVFASEAKEKEALEAGAEYAGFNEYFEKIKNGWLDFDVLICSPDQMREVGKLGKILGPKGLMPSPKSGTVTPDVVDAVKEVQRGKIDYRVDKFGNINVGIGKLSFEEDKIASNAKAVFGSISKARPATVKGEYVRSVYLSSTMGPGVRLDFKTL
jgi:large subunit ribosomal protein L1